MVASLAKVLYPLITNPENDLQPNIHTAMEYARLLNEARNLLASMRCNIIGTEAEMFVPAMDDLETRCCEKCGPMIPLRR